MGAGRDGPARTTRSGRGAARPARTRASSTRSPRSTAASRPASTTSTSTRSPAASSAAWRAACSSRTPPSARRPARSSGSRRSSSAEPGRIPAGRRRWMVTCAGPSCGIASICQLGARRLEEPRGGGAAGVGEPDLAGRRGQPRQQAQQRRRRCAPRRGRRRRAPAARAGRAAPGRVPAEDGGRRAATSLRAALRAVIATASGDQSVASTRPPASAAAIAGSPSPQPSSITRRPVSGRRAMTRASARELGHSSAQYGQELLVRERLLAQQRLAVTRSEQRAARGRAVRRHARRDRPSITSHRPREHACTADSTVNSKDCPRLFTYGERV